MNNILKVVLLLGLAWTSRVDAGWSIVCNEYDVDVDYDTSDLMAIGINADDYLIVNDAQTDVVSGIDAECKQLGPATGSLTFNLTQCEPAIMQDAETITFQWFARNADQGIAKRDDACVPLNCSYPRMVNVTASDVNTNLTKVTENDVVSEGSIMLELNTYDSGYYNTTSTMFNVHDPIFARVAIVNLYNVPDIFFVQIQSCRVDNSYGNITYPLIAAGAAVSDPPASITVQLPPYGKTQDFNFDSFIFTDDPTSDLTLICKVYLCNSESGADCENTLIAPAGTRRKRALFEEELKTVRSPVMSVINV